MKTHSRTSSCRSHSVHLIGVAALSLLLAGLSGCSKNYIVMSRLVENTRLESSADVTPSRSYSSSTVPKRVARIYEATRLSRTLTSVSTWLIRPIPMRSIQTDPTLTAMSSASGSAGAH